MSRKLIQLTGGPPWGFRMCGGKDTTSALRIARVNPESKAARYGVREGDLVTGINGDNVEHLTNAEVQKVLKKSGESISLELRNAKRVNVVGESAGVASGEGAGAAAATSSSSTHIPGGEKEANSKEGITKTFVSVHDIQVTSSSTTVTSNSSPTTVTATGAAPSPEKIKKGGKERKSNKKKEGKEAKVKEKDKPVEEPSPPNQIHRVQLEIKEEELRGQGSGAPVDGVWSPGGTKESESSSPLIRDSGHNGTSSTKPEEPILPVWTPTTAPSPNSERKFRPVNFNAPASPKLSGGAARSSSLERAPSPPKREIVRSASWNQSPGVYTPQQQGHHPPQPPSLHQTPENHPFSSSQLPKYQNPTITLLQKAREGQLPKGAHYLDHKTPPLVRSTSASSIPPHTRPGNFQSRAAAFNPSETLYEVRGVEEGRPTGRSIEYTPRKFQGTGPTTPDGVPLALRAGIKGEQQHEFYKRWYQSLHVDKPNKSDFVTVKYRRKGRSAYGGGGQNSGSWSEPEGYESDSYAYNRYATLDRRKLRDRNFEADYFSPEPFSPTSSTVPGIRFQPGRIEDYTPGAASSAPVRVQRVKSSPQWGIGKDLGYESDSNLIIRKREEVQSTPPPPPLSPLEQRQVYVDIQKGGEVPLQGLRKPAPEKNRASFLRRVVMPTFEEFKRGIPASTRSGGADSPRSVRSGSPALIKSGSKSTFSLLQDRIQAKLSRSKSDLERGAPKMSPGRTPVPSRPIASRTLTPSAAAAPSKVIHTKTITIRKSPAAGTSGIPLRTLSRDSSFEKLGIRSPELTSPREVRKAMEMETAHKLTIKLEVEKPAGKSTSMASGVLRKSGLKKPVPKNGKTIPSPAKAKSVKITIDGNGIPTKPPRKAREADNLNSGTGKSPKPGVPKPTKVTPVASRHAGCLSPHQSRPSSPSHPLSKSTSTSLSNILRGPNSSTSNLQTSAGISGGSTSTLRDRNPLVKYSSSIENPSGNRTKLDSNKRKPLCGSFPSITATSGIGSNGTAMSSTKVRVGPGSLSSKKLLRESGDGVVSEKEKKANRLTTTTGESGSGRKSKSDTDSGISVDNGNPPPKLKKSDPTNFNGSNEETPLRLIASPSPEKPLVRLAQQKKTHLCSNLSPNPLPVGSAYFTLPGRRKGFHSRDYSCYDLLSSLDDSTFRSLPALTPYLKETKRVSNSSFVKNGNRSMSPSPIPRPTLTSFLRERLAAAGGAAAVVKRSSSLQSLRGKKEYSSYVLELQHSRRKSPRFLQLHRLYSSLERLGELEKSASMYDIPILALDKQVDFDAWWKVRKRVRVDAEIESISSQLSTAQRNREFFFRPRQMEEFRWKGDSALRIKKWTTEELRGFLVEWMRRPDAYKSALDLHKTAWRGTTVRELALNMEVAALARNGYYAPEGSLGRYGWLRRAFSMSSTLSDEQRSNIKQRLGTLIKKNTENTDEGGKSNTREGRSRPVFTSRMGSTTSSAGLVRTDSGRIIGADGCMTESVKRQLSRTLSQEIRERKVRQSLRNSSEGDGDSSDHSGKTVIHVPVSTQVLFQKNKYKDTCTKNKIPAYSMYCKHGVPSKVNFFETYYNSDTANGNPPVTMTTSMSPSVQRLPPVIEKPKNIAESTAVYLSNNKSPIRAPSPEKNSRSSQYDPRLSPVFTRRSRSVSPTWRDSPSCSDKKHSYMSHVNVISKLAALILKRDESLKELIRKEILEYEKLERLRLANKGEVDRLKYYYENYYPKDWSKVSPEVNLLRCLFCSDSNLARLTNCASPHRRCASAELFKEKLMDDLYDRAPDGREASPAVSVTPDLYFNSRSRKPIYQPSSTPNVCQPTLTAHCYLESPTKSIVTDYGSDISGGLWDYFSDSPNTISLSPTPSSAIGSAQRGGQKNWNYDPSIHQPKSRYVPPQPHYPPPPPIPPPPNSDRNELNNSSQPQLYRSVRHWIPNRKEHGASHHQQRGVTPPRRHTFTSSQTPIGGYNNNYSIDVDNNRTSSDVTSPNLRRAQEEIESQMRVLQAELDSHRRAISPNASYSPDPGLPSPLSLSPVKYAESEVNIHYKAPVRLEEKDYIGEEELRQRQQAAMKKFYEDQRHRKFLQEIQDIENRRHTYNVIPSQKSPIPLNRYEDAIDESQSPRWRERTPEPKYAARALYNFVAQNPRELNFRKGDILFLQKKLDKNWYRATCYGGEGLVPANYVEIIQSHNGDRATPNVPSEGQAKVRFNFVAASPAEMSIAKGETIVLTRRVDPNWYEGRIANRSGIFPVSYVQVLKEPGAVNSSLSPKPIGAPAARTLIPSQNGSEMYQGSHHYNPIHQYSMKTDVGNIQNSRRQQSSINGHSLSGLNHDLTIDTRNDTSTYRAIYNYLPANNDELELCENDVIQVFEKCDDGWYVGVSVRTGLFGTFPGNYVERIY